MSIELKVPDLGVDGEVEVVEILVSKGESIDIDDPICVLESDKATMEVPAESAGTVAQLSIKVGDKVTQGDLMMSLSGSATPSEESYVASQNSADNEPDEPPAVTASKEANASSGAGTETSVSEIDVSVPDLGGAEAVELIELNIEVGQTVDAEETILVLESDKATMEIPAPQAGSWISIEVKTGDKLSEGDLIGRMKVESSSPKAVAQPETEKAQQPAEQKKDPVQRSITNAPASPSEPSSSSSVHAGPAVRKLARELGVDLAQVSGTGPNARILKDDVKVFVKTSMQTKSSGATVGLPAAAPLPDFSKFGEFETRTMDKVQQVTASNMQSNWSTIPHVTQFDEADITELESFRKSEGAKLKEQGIKLTVLAFLVKACAKSLQEFPRFNS